MTAAARSPLAPQPRGGPVATITKEYAMTIHDASGKMVLSIKYDGNVDFGEGITPDAAAQRFWDAIRECKK